MSAELYTPTGLVPAKEPSVPLQYAGQIIEMFLALYRINNPIFRPKTETVFNVVSEPTELSRFLCIG
jgi:hypothetical protein